MTPASAAAELLAKVGKNPACAVTPLPGGRNNTVWRVDCDNESYLLKKYFWSESDPRDRLGQEWAFLEFLQSIGCEKGPFPLAKTAANRHALLEFIDGKTPDDISPSDILDAAGFLIAINADPSRAAGLPPVSEACFSIQNHLKTTARRVEMLDLIQPESPDHAGAIEFVRNRLRPLWAQIRERIENLPHAERTVLLPPGRRCVSPSDFGFHNALRQPDGTLRYLDFEYAGWDDPAKTLIDFTNQPDRILPENLATLFLEKTIAAFPNSDTLRERIEILTPLYQLKWACICLNAFLAGRPADPSRPLYAQLARAETMCLRAKNKAPQSGG